MAGDGTYKRHLVDQFYYRCTDRIKNGPIGRICQSKSIRADKLEKIVWNQVSNLIRNPELIKKHFELKLKEKNKIDKISKLNLVELQNNLERLSKEESRIISLYRQNIITIPQLKEQIESINISKNKVQQNILNITNQNNEGDVNINISSFIKFTKLISKQLTILSFEEKQQLLKLLIDKIIVGKNRIKIIGLLPEYKSNMEYTKFGYEPLEDKPISNALLLSSYHQYCRTT
jgi:site-specific DNA recombinase